jgi:hypothetical protein
MPWNLTHNRLLDIVEIEYTGIITGADIESAATQRITLMNKTKTNKTLIDTSSVKYFTGSILDIYNLPYKLYDLQCADRTMKIALICPSKHELHDLAEFYIKICSNRDWCSRLFGHRQGALDWLKTTITGYS